jgi:hypothetical protein
MLKSRSQQITSGTPAGRAIRRFGSGNRPTAGVRAAIAPVIVPGVYRLVNRHPPNTNNRMTMIRRTSMTLLRRSRGALTDSVRSGR